MEADKILYSVGLDSTGFKKGSSNVVNSISYMENSLDLLRTEIKKAEVGSESFKKIGQSITLMENKLESANQQVMANMGVMQNQGRMAQKTRLLNNELAFTIQDGAYAFNDLRMGVLGMSNNLPRVAMQMRDMRGITGSWTGAIKKTVAGLFSFNGIMSIAVGALVAWSALSGRSKDETERLDVTLEDLITTTDKYAKSLEKLRGEVRDLSIEDFSTKWDELYSSMRKAQEELSKILAKSIAFSSIQGGGFLAQLFGGSEGDIDKAVEKIGQIVTLMDEIEQQAGAPGIIGQLKIKLKELREELDQASTVSQINKLNKEIEGTEKRLNSLLGKNKPKKIAESIQLMTSIMSSGFTKANALLVQSADAMLSVKGRAETAAEAVIRLAEAQEKLNQKSEAFVTESGGLRFSDKFRDPGRKPTLEPLSEDKLREHFKTADILSESAAQTMEDAFNQAWDNIFGHANSLFESFLQNVVSGFVNIAANYVSGGLFSFFSGLFSDNGGAPSSANSTTNYLVVDGEVMGKFVDERTPYSVNRAIRLNKL